MRLVEGAVEGVEGALRVLRVRLRLVEGTPHPVYTGCSAMSLLPRPSRSAALGPLVVVVLTQYNPPAPTVRSE